MRMQSTIALFSCLLIHGCIEVKKANNDEDPRFKNTQKQVDEFIKSNKIPALDRTETLAGRDFDSNGIRDDIEDQIIVMPIDSSQRSHSYSYARTIQDIMTSEFTTESEVRNLSNNYMLAELCLFHAFRKDQHNLQKAVVNKIRSYTLNTKQRNRQYYKFDAKMNGKVFSIPSRSRCSSY